MKTKDIILTIAIPTYNRKDFLIKNIEQLLPQLNDQIKLLILDNHSDEEMKVVLFNTLPNIVNKNVKIIRNRVNIGGDANIIRCFEYCDTPYLWILGDDDVPLENAIDKIIFNILKQPNVIFFNYSTSYIRNNSFKAVGLYDFVDKIDEYSNLLFISNNIYKVKNILSNIRFAYNNLNSMAAQLVILIQSLNDVSETYFSTEQIVIWGKPTSENNWSHMCQSLGNSSIQELPVIVRNGLSKKIAKKIQIKSTLLSAYKSALLLTDSDKYNYRTKKYIFDQIIYRRFYFYPAYIRFFRIPLGWLLIIPRSIIVKILKLVDKDANLTDKYFN